MFTLLANASTQSLPFNSELPLEDGVYLSCQRLGIELVRRFSVIIGRTADLDGLGGNHGVRRRDIETPD